MIDHYSKTGRSPWAFLRGVERHLRIRGAPTFTFLLLNIALLLLFPNLIVAQTVTFSAKPDVAIDNAPRWIASGDFNHAGNLDLAMPNTRSWTAHER